MRQMGRLNFLILYVTILGYLLSGDSTFADTRVRGYYRSNGTYVMPHMRSSPNRTRSDNWSTKGNYNPYTGKPGSNSIWTLPSIPTISNPAPNNYRQQSQGILPAAGASFALPGSPTNSLTQPDNSYGSLYSPPIPTRPDLKLISVAYWSTAQGLNVRKYSSLEVISVDRKNLPNLIFMRVDKDKATIRATLTGPATFRCGEGAFSDKEDGTGLCQLPIENSRVFGLPVTLDWAVGRYLLTIESEDGSGSLKYEIVLS